MSRDELIIRHSPASWNQPQEVHFRVTSFSRQWKTRPHLWRPPTDLLETEKALVVRMEIAGMQDAELHIAVEGRQLALYGLRQPPSQSGAYHQLEVRYGDFLSVLELPAPVDTERIEAEYSDGFLLVTLPKAGNS
ncbi:MAG: Hsp20/alpha crystallin family protein [Anaerolineales bacterium]|nr:Hsp20/alpha crystallin family protein [Anaerolineales bacterium]